MFIATIACPAPGFLYGTATKSLTPRLQAFHS
jgi:hypothetical protein